ncbi:MAG TPA: ABC transporter substrate-binding protein [Candidatus Binatia bacterium]|nr:ABC transporter substrate-binding protein [Candidatus Binatia bacterium]
MSLRALTEVAKKICFGLCLVLLDLCTASAAAPTEKATLIFADFSERAGLLFVAKDQHFFEEQGLDVDVVQVRSGPIAISAMAANEAQIYSVSATGASLGAMAGGLDLVFVAGLINRLDGYFAVSSKIRAPDDLKGKIIGVQSIGGGIWMFTQILLDHWGLNAERDKIQIRAIGDDSVLAQAVMTGVIDGAVLGYTYSRVISQKGGRILVELPQLNIPYQGTGIVARRSFIERAPDAVEKTLRSLIRANRFIQDKKNQPMVIRSLRKWLRLAPTDSAEDLYDRIRMLYDRSIIPTREGIQSALRLLSKADAKFAKLKAEDLVDDRIARKLERDGF